MRFVIFSDVHGNLEALDAVLDAVSREDHDRVLVLGDLVGYGANPNEVVERIHALKPNALIRGNHDKVACGLEDPLRFNQVAAKAARWTLDTLTEANRARIAELAQGPRHVDDLVEICHGTPYDEDIYIFDENDASHAFEAASRPICFFGHTHVPVAYLRPAAGGTPTAVHPEPGALDPTVLTLEPDTRYLINPGSVGQPRDADPRAAYATLDLATNQVRFVRVPYRVDVAQQKILDAGLPASLARRLGVGR